LHIFQNASVESHNLGKGEMTLKHMMTKVHVSTNSTNVCTQGRQLLQTIPAAQKKNYNKITNNNNNNDRLTAFDPGQPG